MKFNLVLSLLILSEQLIISSAADIVRGPYIQTQNLIPSLSKVLGQHLCHFLSVHSTLLEIGRLINLCFDDTNRTHSLEEYWFGHNNNVKISTASQFRKLDSQDRKKKEKTGATRISVKIHNTIRDTKRDRLGSKQQELGKPVALRVYFEDLNNSDEESKIVIKNFQHKVNYLSDDIMLTSDEPNAENLEDVNESSSAITDFRPNSPLIRMGHILQTFFQRPVNFLREFLTSIRNNQYFSSRNLLTTHSQSSTPLAREARIESTRESPEVKDLEQTYASESPSEDIHSDIATQDHIFSSNNTILSNSSFTTAVDADIAASRDFELISTNLTAPSQIDATCGRDVSADSERMHGRGLPTCVAYGNFWLADFDEFESRSEMIASGVTSDKGARTIGRQSVAGVSKSMASSSDIDSVASIPGTIITDAPLDDSNITVHPLVDMRSLWRLLLTALLSFPLLRGLVVAVQKHRLLCLSDKESGLCSKSPRSMTGSQLSEDAARRVDIQAKHLPHSNTRAFDVDTTRGLEAQRQQKEQQKQNEQCLTAEPIPTLSPQRRPGGSRPRSSVTGALAWHAPKLRVETVDGTAEAHGFTFDQVYDIENYGGSPGYFVQAEVNLSSSKSVVQKTNAANEMDSKYSGAGTTELSQSTAWCAGVYDSRTPVARAIRWGGGRGGGGTEGAPRSCSVSCDTPAAAACGHQDPQPCSGFGSRPSEAVMRSPASGLGSRTKTLLQSPRRSWSNRKKSADDDECGRGERKWTAALSEGRQKTPTSSAPGSLSLTSDFEVDIVGPGRDALGRGSLEGASSGFAYSTSASPFCAASQSLPLDGAQHAGFTGSPDRQSTKQSVGVSSPLMALAAANKPFTPARAKPSSHPATEIHHTAAFTAAVVTENDDGDDDQDDDDGIQLTWRDSPEAGRDRNEGLGEFGELRFPIEGEDDVLGLSRLAGSQDFERGLECETAETVPVVSAEQHKRFLADSYMLSQWQAAAEDGGGSDLEEESAHRGERGDRGDCIGAVAAGAGVVAGAMVTAGVQQGAAAAAAAAATAPASKGWGSMVSGGSKGNGPGSRSDAERTSGGPSAGRAISKSGGGLTPHRSPWQLLQKAAKSSAKSVLNKAGLRSGKKSQVLVAAAKQATPASSSVKAGANESPQPHSGKNGVSGAVLSDKAGTSTSSSVPSARSAVGQCGVGVDAKECSDKGVEDEGIAKLRRRLFSEASSSEGLEKWLVAGPGGETAGVAALEVYVDHQAVNGRASFSTGTGSTSSSPVSVSGDGDDTSAAIRAGGSGSAHTSPGASQSVTPQSVTKQKSQKSQERVVEAVQVVQSQQAQQARPSKGKFPRVVRKISNLLSGGSK